MTCSNCRAVIQVKGVDSGIIVKEVELCDRHADLERQLQSKEQHCAVCGGVECHALAGIFCHLHTYEGCREWEGCPICKVGNLETQLLADNETLEKMERQLQAAERLLWELRQFIEYARYELKDNAGPMRQFPDKTDADEKLLHIKEWLERRGNGQVSSM